MSANETTQPAQRINISDPKAGPNPPWTNLYFDCDCGARYQLGCADELFGFISKASSEPRILAPPCWTCGKVNVLPLPVAQSPAH